MLLILLAVGGGILAAGHQAAKAVGSLQDQARIVDPATYRNHKLTDPVAMAAAVKRHDRPYLGPRTRSKRRR